MRRISSQTKANKKWQEKNREKARYLRDRSTTRGFIKNKATLEDTYELMNILSERIKKLNNSLELEDKKEI